MRIQLIIIFILLCGSIVGQTFKLEVHLPYFENQSIKLAYHYLDKIYVRDSIQLNSEGYGSLQIDTILPQGLYTIYADQDHHFDFLLGADQQFSLSNSTFKSADTKVNGAIETEEFFAYLVFLEKMKQRSTELNKTLQSSNNDGEKAEIRNKMNGLNTQMQEYWANIGKKYPESFLYKFLMANYVPTLDVSTLPEETQKNDSLLLIQRFNYQRNHFWDNFDYTDERFLYTPFYKPKLETWFTKVLYPAYDSVKPYVYDFLDNVESNKRIFQFACSFFLNSSINSHIMGMDALFVDLANDYYFSGKAFWASDESLEKVRENVLFCKDNLIGKTAPDLTLESYDGEYVNLHQIESELTVVLIFEPNCSHCKVFVPKFYNEVYLPNTEKGLQVYAIYSMDNKEEWSTFLIQHNLFDWINVWDKDNVSRFKILYDARKTPGVYVLDKNKKIIAKKLTLDALKQLIRDKLN